MSKTSLIVSCEESINYALKRLSKLENQNKKSLECEFREWIDAVRSDNKNYDILYINKIN